MIAAALLGAVGASAQQQRGTITGQVTSRAGGQPLGGVAVIVRGTALRAVTDQQGQYRIANVAPGAYELTAAVLGHTAGSQRIAVVDGQAVTADFVLEASALEIGGLVVTATGREQRQREIGSSVGTVDVTRTELAPVTNFSQLIQGRVPGAVVLQSSGTTGSGSRIRIRGNNSISLSNAPLVIIDGVRVYENAAAGVETETFAVGGQSSSRLNDINPEDIENVEILKGPAAAALYGTAAANGVLQITTRRGRAGTPQFRAWSEYGSIQRGVEFPENVYAVGTLVPGSAVTDVRMGQIGRCDIVRQAIGTRPRANEVGCSGVTETYRFNPLENAATSPFRDGVRRTLGGSISGGSENATFYVSSDYETETGILPQNDLRKVQVQANGTGRAGPNLNIGFNVGFTESDLQLPMGDNALFGIIGMGLYGDARPSFVDNNQGFRNNPQFFYDWKSFQDLSRFTGSARADYRPFSWLSVNATAGLDRVASSDVNRIPRETAYSVFGDIFTEGWIQEYDFDVYNATTNGSATAIFNLTDAIVSTTTLGSQYLREDFQRTYAFGATLTPGIETSLAGTNTAFSVGESNVLNATLATYAQQQFAWNDRVFVNAAVRGDKNTAFGTDIGWIWYPALSASWVISEEGFFPAPEWLDNLRLRAAVGQSGLRPGATDALQSFQPTVGVFESADVAGIIANEIGNPDLKPERSTEWELGFESGVFDNRLGLQATYFSKTSTDALVNRPLPPSVGAGVTRFENLGEVRNSGVEIQLNGQPVRGDAVDLNFTVTGSFIENELVDLGEDAQGNPITPIIFGLISAQRHVEGHPLGSWFQLPIESYADADGNGLLTASEVKVGAEPAYLGNPFPTRELSFNSDMTLWKTVRLSALLDYKGGFQIMNFTRRNRCRFPNVSCAEVFDPGTPLETQAAIVAMNSYNTNAGFVEDGSFVKLREVALSFSLPESLARQVRSSGLRLTLAGRNLKTWTDYTGLDPEVNFAGQANYSSGDAATLPANRLFTVRIDANF